MDVFKQVRDPRGLIAAQKKHGKYNQPEYFCNQLGEVGRMVRNMKEEGRTNIHEVFYEELALNASYYGTKMYQ